MTKSSQRNLWINLGIGVFLTGLFLLASLRMDGWVIEAMPATVSPVFFPRLTAMLLTAFSVSLVIVSLRGLRRAARTRTDAETDGDGTTKETGEEAGQTLALCAYVAVMFLYLAGLHYVGFVISTPPAMLAVGLMLGLRRWLPALICYVAFTLALDYAAFHFMQIILPTGTLFS